MNLKKQLFFYKKFQKYELKRLLGRVFFSDLRVIFLIRYVFNIFFLLRDSYLTKKNLFCFFSYKTKGIIRPFNLYRMLFRRYCFFGLISGIRRGTW